MLLNTIAGIFGCGLLCLAVAGSGFRLHRFSFRARIALMLAAALAVFVPVGGLSVAGYVRGITGDVSMTTLILAAAACMAQLSGRALIGRRDRRALLCVVVAGALFLYPFALGLTRFDPYALGFGSVGFVTTLLLLTLAAWYTRLNLIVLVVTAAALAYLGGGYESRNLWDYLIDPLVSAYALVWLLASAYRSRARWLSSRAAT